jgi:hypothetical protein
MVPHRSAYVVAQVLGAIAASWLLYFVATSNPGADPVAASFAANGYGDTPPAGSVRARHLVGIPVTNTSVKPGAQHGAGYGRRRMGGRTALDALGSASRPSVSRPRSATRS